MLTYMCVCACVCVCVCVHVAVHVAVQDIYIYAYQARRRSVCFQQCSTPGQSTTPKYHNT